MEMFSKVKYLDDNLRQKVGQDADKKFGSKNSYVKNLWILREYKKRGGKVRNEGKKPSKESIKKQVSATLVFDNDNSILEYILKKEFETFDSDEFSEIRADFQKIIDSEFSDETIDEVLFAGADKPLGSISDNIEQFENSLKDLNALVAGIF